MDHGVGGSEIKARSSRLQAEKKYWRFARLKRAHRRRAAFGDVHADAVDVDRLACDHRHAETPLLPPVSALFGEFTTGNDPYNNGFRPQLPSTHSLLKPKPP